jgi:hypothetical protein
MKPVLPVRRIIAGIIAESYSAIALVNYERIR